VLAGHDLLRPIVAALANRQTVLSAEKFLMFICIVAVTFFLPQLAVALVGGFLFRDFKLRMFVERRDHSPIDGPSSY